MRGSQLEGGEGLSTKVQNSSEISAGLTLDQVRRGGRAQGRSDDPEVVAPGPGRTAVRFIRQKNNHEKAAEHRRLQKRAMRWECAGRNGRGKGLIRGWGEDLIIRESYRRAARAGACCLDRHLVTKQEHDSKTALQ